MHTAARPCRTPPAPDLGPAPVPASPLSKAPPASSLRARPFLKWAGGKTQLLPHILPLLPRGTGRYYEPFLGGGAVFFALQPTRATLSDINPDLMVAYQAVRDEVESVIERLRRLRFGPATFYKIRAQSPSRLTPAAQAARTIYLNRTCFNGLYRVNAAGQFNVPFGRYERPTLCNADNLRRVSRALRRCWLRKQPATALLRQCRRGDVVYFDPPYDPVSRTASFTGYARGGFGRDAQAELAEVFDRLATRGVHVVLSNANTAFIRQLYRRFCLTQVPARRAINCAAHGRGPVSELLICPERPARADACHAPPMQLTTRAGACSSAG